MASEYVYLVSRGYLYRINLDKLSGGNQPPPPVELVVDFRREGLPIGMGVFSYHNSKIYLVGGEIIKNDTTTLSRVLRAGVLDTRRGDYGVSSDVCEYDPFGPKKQNFPSSSNDVVPPFKRIKNDVIPGMLGPKSNPKIATVDGKIYTLGTKAHCGLCKIWHPAFECYDPSLGKWEELPEPPHYNDVDVHASILSSFFVFERKIYINNGFGLSYFDVDLKVWKDFVAIFREATLNSPEFLSYTRLEDTASIAQGENGLVVAHTFGGGLKAYLYEANGEFRQEERLGNIDDDFVPLACKEGSVHFLGNGRFCIVLHGLGLPGKYWCVRVTTFEVIVQMGDGIKIIDARRLTSHDYDLSLRVPDSEPPFLENVFIAKGGEQELEDPFLVDAAYNASDKIKVDAYNHWFSFHVSGPLPKPCSEHVAAAIEDKMYILGGAQGGIYLNDLHALDMSSWTWSKVIVEGSGEAALTARVALSARSSLVPLEDDKLILIGGYSSVFMEVMVFDLKRSTWSTLETSGRPPVSRRGQSVTVVKRRLVVFGGEDLKGSLLNDVHILDLTTSTWDEINSLSGPVPCPRMDHAAAVHEARYLFIFGGRSDCACLNDLHVLDLKAMKWSTPSQIGHVPNPRAGHAGVVSGKNNWIIAGGEDENGKGIISVPDTIVLNMRVLHWSILTSVDESGPHDSKGLSIVAGSSRGRLILVSFGGNFTNKVNVLKPWCKIE